MEGELDPKEVLMHLHEIGYKNITAKQLEEFMTDLKRLIKHETKKDRRKVQKQQTEDKSSTLPNTTDESASPRSPPPVPRGEPRRHHSRYNTVGVHDIGGVLEASCSSSDSSIPSSRKVLRECTKLVAQKSEDKTNKKNRDGSTKSSAKPTKSCDCMWRRIGCKSCDDDWAKEQQSIKTSRSKENLAPPRPKSSFIRTWQKTGHARPQRCDPVALYHHYQQIWKERKLPGEDNHNDLRWSIRERMLGQDPQPRPPSQASSVSSMNKHRKRL